MKFTSYQNNAQLGGIASGVTGFKYSDPAATALAKAPTTAQVMVAGANSIVDRINTAKGMEANNYYNKRMTEESADLMNNHKEGEALQIVDMYDKVQKKVLDETQKKFGNYIGYGKAAETFNTFTEKDNATRRNGMMQYQMAETEKYDNTVFADGVKVCRDMALAGGYSPQAMDIGFSRSEALVGQRYSKYGMDRMNSEYKKLRTQLVKDAMDYSIINKDFNKADVMLGAYSKDMTPEMQNIYKKEITTYREQKHLKNTEEQLYEATKGDASRLEEYFKNSKPLNGEALGEFNKSLEGAQYVLGGDGESGWDCGLYTQHAAAALGKTLDSRAADMQYAQLEKEGMVTTDRDAAGDYALIFWSGTSDRWTPTDNPNGGEDTCYKGITHVGIMMPNGKAMQMGSNGLSEMDPDTYNVVGYGKLQTGYTQEEQDAIKQYFKARKSQEKAEKADRIDKMAEAFRYQVIELKKKDVPGYQIYDQLTEGVSDTETRDAIASACRAEGISITKPNRTGGNPTGKPIALDAAGEAALAEYIRAGAFNSMTDLTNWMADPERNFNQAAINKARKMFDDYTNLRGEFKYDLRDLATQAADSYGYKGETRKAYINGFIQVGRVYVNKYRADPAHPGEDPDTSDVLEEMMNSNSAPLTYNRYVPERNWFMAENFQATPAQLAAQGIMRLDPVEGEEGGNAYMAVFYDGRPSQYMTGQELDVLLGRAKK